MLGNGLTGLSRSGSPAGQPKQAPSQGANSQGKAQKAHKWNGSLVDAACMADALRRVPALDQLASSQPLSQYYFQGMENNPTPSQGSGPGAPSTPGPPATQGEPQQGQSRMPDRPTGALDPGGEPESSQRELDLQRAQLRRAELLKRQIAKCSPGRPTKDFGLVVADGHFLKFDARGNLEAKRALQASAVQPGKPVKATVTGAIVAKGDTVTVASIEIKGRTDVSQAVLERRPCRV